MLYLTLDEIKKHLNIDSDFTEDDAYLESLETVAVELIQKHIDHSLNLLEVDGKLPLSLQQGILLCIGNFYNNRESVAYAQSHEVPSNLQWILDLYQYYDSTTESGGDSDIDKKITELEAKIKELVVAIEAKADQSVIDTLTSDIANLSNTVSKIQSTVDAVEPKITALDSSVASIQSEVTTFKSDVDKSISNLSNTVSTKLDTTTFTEYQTTVDTKFDNIEKEISTAGKIQDVQVNGKSVVSDKVAKIDLSGYATSSTIESIQSQVSTNTTNIGTNSKNISSIKSDVSTIKGDITTLSNKIPTKTSQLTNDSNYYSTDQPLNIKGESINFYYPTGSYSTLVELDNDDQLCFLDKLFYYPDNGNPYFAGDFDVKNGSVVSFTNNSSITLYSDDDNVLLTIQHEGISLSGGTANQLFSANGKTYDIGGLQSSVSTNTSNIKINTNNISALTTRVTTLESTVANIDTLLTTILNG